MMNRFITSLIAILSITVIRAQNPTEIPKLVVNITVDQLRGDYLQYFNSTFGERGFKRLLNEGMVYSQVQYNFPNLGQSTSIASLYTGTEPCYNGIVADKKYDFEKKREVPIVYDANYLGNYTSDNLSPAALMSSTIGDELKIASDGRSDVYAIAPNATQAILSGGHFANAVFWLENYSGKWATTTFYKNIPWYVDRFNMNEGISLNPEVTWAPSLAQYKAFPYSKANASFRYSISKGDKDKFLKIKTSPFINTEVTNLAKKFLEYGDFGKRITPDMLAITYYAGNYKENIGNDYGAEIQDIYCRLDKEIEQLLDLIEKHVGINNTLIVLTSTGYFESKEMPSETFKPSGEFYPNRCTALLNMYLMALYGQGSWVEGYYNNQIYLNKKLIEDKKIDFDVFQRKAVEFVIQFSGIQNVTTSGQFIFENKDEGNAAFRRGMYRQLSGDIFVEIKPGWIVMDEKNPSESKYIRNNAVICPLIFFGSNVQKQKINRIVKATEIAPTISYILRIRPPNASKELPLQEFFKN